MIGIDPIKTVHSIMELPCYFRDLQILYNQKASAVREFPFRKFYPCLGERHKFSDGGSAKGHYFHQDLLVARRIYLDNPSTHIDIGSRIDGFVAHVASFRPIIVIDIRPLSSDIPNVKFIQADLMAPIRDDLAEYCDSLSCLHALEHFGLGRYGDPVNYEGYLLGLNNLHRILKKGGKLYLSVPIGPQRIEFNAHRVFSVTYLMECFDGRYHIDRFSFVDDQGDLHENAPIMDDSVQNNFGCVYGCGIFEMTKL
jgi:SAM-dependent methyltransferase